MFCEVLIVVGVVCLITEALRRGFLGRFDEQEEAGDEIDDLGRKVVERHREADESTVRGLTDVARYVTAY